MTVTLPAAAGLLHISLRHLKNLLGAVLPFAPAPDDDELPSLTRLHAEVQHGELRLFCTDRYTLALARQPLTAAPAGFAARLALPLDQIRQFLQDLGEFADADPMDVLIEKEQLTVNVGDYTRTISTEGMYIDWRTVFAQILVPADVPTSRLLIDPAFLARLESAKALLPEDDSRRMPMRMQFRGEHSGIVITYSTVFLAMIMPARKYDDDLSMVHIRDRPLDTWFDILDEDVPAKPDEAAEPAAA